MLNSHASFWIWCVLITLSGSLYAQQTPHDLEKIKSQLASSPSDSNHVFLLEELTNLYYNINVDSANHYATKTLELAQTLDFKKGIALGYLRVGFAKILLGDISRSIPLLEKSIEVADSIQDPNITSRAYANLGRCMLDLGNNVKAIEYFKRAITIRRVISANDEITGMLLTTIGEAYLDIGNVKDSKIYLDSALSLHKQNHSSFERALNSMGNWYIHTQVYDLADSTLHLAWEEIKVKPDLLLKAKNRYYLAKLAWEEGKTESAFTYGIEAEKYSQLLGSISIRGDVYGLLAAIEAKRDRSKQSLDYLTRSIAIRDSIQSSRSRNSALLFEHREQERLELINQNKLSILEAKKNTQLAIFLSAIVVFVLISCALLYSVLQKKKSNKKLLEVNRTIQELNKNLIDRENQLSAANEELIQQQEEIVTQLEFIEEKNVKLEEANRTIDVQNKNLERTVKNRTKEIVAYNMQLEQFAFISAHNIRGPVARILGLGNVLKATAENDEREDVINMMIETTIELDAVINDLNRILSVQKNNTDIFEKVNIREELLLVRGILKTEIDQTQCEIIEDFSACEEIYGIKAYLNSILYNLVSNAIKFRNTNKQLIIEIKTALTNKKIQLSVADNGIGFDTETHKNDLFKLYKRYHNHVEGRGIGLYMVKTQALAINATIEVESKPGTGTVFTLSI